MTFPIMPVSGNDPENFIYVSLQKALKLNAAHASFSRLLFRSVIASVFAPLWRRKPVRFAAAVHSHPRQESSETFEVAVALIVPRLGAAKDFDRKFRPLRSKQRAAWVRSYLTFDRARDPELVLRPSHKGYIVEEGAYTLSVMISLGYKHVDARVRKMPVVTAVPVAAGFASRLKRPDLTWPPLSAGLPAAAKNRRFPARFFELECAGGRKQRTCKYSNR